MLQHEIEFYKRQVDRSAGYFNLHEVSRVDDVAIQSFEIVAPSKLNDKTLPVLGIIAGVHGIEAVGVKVVRSFVEHLVEQLSWNEFLRTLFERVRIVGLPIVNPIGFRNGTRCNGRGVDLMRNAPVECENSLFLIGGQKWSPRLPYFRGFGELEPEAQALISFVENVKAQAPFSLFLDVHSGFGTTDYLWTPYAKEQQLPRDWPHFVKVKALLDSTLKHHMYKFEPQFKTYCTHGDLWDYMYDRHLASNSQNGPLFLPMTLEIGSWNWLKKSPYMAFRLRNFFNPVHSHRKRRVLRRHRPFLDFLLQMTASYRGLF